jgi:hypothetical protein
MVLTWVANSGDSRLGSRVSVVVIEAYVADGRAGYLR